MLLPEMDSIIKVTFRNIARFVRLSCFSPDVWFQFMLECTQDDDERVSLEACEFWLAMVEQMSVRQHLIPVMEELLPVLLRLAQLSDLELIALKVG
jgi:hypothetical protein